MLNLNKTLDFTRGLAKKVGKFLAENQEKVAVRKYKDKEDVLTNIDLRAEEIILDGIKKNFPRHNILSEEKGLIDNQSDYTWLVDPLDASKEYSRGLPLFGNAILLEKNGQPQVAVFSLPKFSCLYSAAKNKGAFLNGKRITVSFQEKLSHAFAYAYAPCFTGQNEEKFQTYWLLLAKIAQASYRLRFLSLENLSLCFLAQGGCEVVLNISNPPPKWDLLPGLFIAQEAGARITDLKGRKIDFRNLKQTYIASNGKVHQQFLEMLS